MAFLDSLKEIVSDPSGPGSFIRYGVSPQEKHRMMVEGRIPGMPPMGADNPESERYASGYLATKSGYLPGLANAFGNNIAFDDLGRSPEEAMRVKMAGQRGAETAVGEKHPGLKGKPFLSALAAMLKGVY